jgi:hypothetical protein
MATVRSVSGSNSVSGMTKVTAKDGHFNFTEFVPKG